MQRVFGMSQRLPNSILSDDAIDPALLCDNPLADFQRAEEMRVAATRAWAALDSRNRMHKYCELDTAHHTPSLKACSSLCGDNPELVQVSGLARDSSSYHLAVVAG